MPNSRDEKELELKLVLPPEDLERVLKVLFRERVSEMKRKSGTRFYFDTPKLDLYEDARRIALRTQYNEGGGRKPGGYQQTFKYDIPAQGKLPEGFAYRREWKSGITGLEPDLEKVNDARLAALLKPYMKKELGLKHLMNIPRRLFNIEAGKGKKKGLVEVGFDRGWIIVPAADVHHPVSGIELESKSGHDNGAKYDALMYAMERIRSVASAAEIDPAPSKNAQGMELYKRCVLKIK